MKPPYFLLTRMHGEVEEMVAEVPATKGRRGWFWREPVPDGHAFCVYVVEPESPAKVADPLEVIVGHLAQGSEPVTLATLRDLRARGVLDRVCFGTVNYWGPA